MSGWPTAGQLARLQCIHSTKRKARFTVGAFDSFWRQILCLDMMSVWTKTLIVNSGRHSEYIKLGLISNLFDVTGHHNAHESYLAMVKKKNKKKSFIVKQVFSETVIKGSGLLFGLSKGFDLRAALITIKATGIVRLAEASLQEVMPLKCSTSRNGTHSECLPSDMNVVFIKSQTLLSVWRYQKKRPLYIKVFISGIIEKTTWIRTRLWCHLGPCPSIIRPGVIWMKDSREKLIHRQKSECHVCRQTATHNSRPYCRRTTANI